MPNDQRAWYHVILTTYGAWLPGDERGFRSRHHRQHVDGDYKRPPPPGEYDGLRKSAAESLKQEPVRILPKFAALIGGALRDRLQLSGAKVLCIAVASQHVHLLAHLYRDEPRQVVGKAKLHARFVMREHGWTGAMWGRRSKEIRIRDRSHQLNVFHYILGHRLQGAWVWSFRDG